MRDLGARERKSAVAHVRRTARGCRYTRFSRRRRRARKIEKRGGRDVCNLEAAVRDCSGEKRVGGKSCCSRMENCDLDVGVGRFLY